MSLINCYPLLRSGIDRTSGATQSEKQKWLIVGTGDKQQAEAALEGTVDDYVVMRNGNLLPLTDIEVELIGDVLFNATVTYGTQQNKNQPQISFDTTGGKQKITQSLNTVQSYRSGGGTPTNFLGAIGVTKDGPEGVEIDVPTFSWTEKQWLPDALVTPSYIKGLAGVTGRTNNSTFRAFDVGEVLFLGASGSKTGTELWEITFKFAASPNVTDLQIGDMGPIVKGGWQYLWVLYYDDQDGRTKALIKKPVEVHVEQVYFDADFAALGIGTA